MKGTMVKQREREEEGRADGRGRGRGGKHTGACGVALEFQVCGRPRGELLESRVCNLGNRKSEFP